MMQNENGVEVTKLALVYDPPMLAIEYLMHSSRDGSTFAPKFYHKKIRFKEEYLNDKNRNAETIGKDLKQSFPMYLKSDRVSFDQLVKLVRNLIMVREGRGEVKHSSNSTFHLRRVKSRNSEHSSVGTYATEKVHEDEGERKDLFNSLPSNLHHNHQKDPNVHLSSFGDLNKVSGEELKKAKEEMNIAFDINRVEPGDEGYEYDKRVDFQEAVSDCSWDS